jgi:hypothetical protein
VKVTEKPDGTVEVDTGRQAAAAKATWDGETIAVGPLAKSEPELRYTLNVIYPADKADIAKAADGHRDFASKDVVRKAAWDYMQNYRAVGTCHTEAQAAAVGVPLLQDGAAELVESYIWPGPDWEPVEGFVVKSGDWLGGFVWSPEAWAAIKDGRLGGVSVEGGAKRRKPAAAAVAGLRS